MPGLSAAGTSSLGIELSLTPGRAEVRVRGELDLATADELQKVLKALRHDGYRRLVLDVSGVEFLGAHGLQVLDTTARELRGDHGSLTVVNPTRMIRRVLELTGLADQFLADSPPDGQRGS